jgi:hypothetical protein
MHSGGSVGSSDRSRSREGAKCFTDCSFLCAMVQTKQRGGRAGIRVRSRGPQDEAGVRGETRQGGRPTGEVSSGLIHQRTLPCLPVADTAGMNHSSVFERECTDGGPACQLMCGILNQPWPSASSYDATMVRSSLFLLQLARRFRLEQRDPGRMADGILVTPSSTGCRSPASSCRLHAGRASRQSAPWWASDTPPGIGI